MKPHPHSSRRPRAGFTLIELLVTVSILGILMSLAVPSLNDALMNVRLTGQANDLLTDLALARSEAVKRIVQTGVCARNAAGTACSGTNVWSAGWIVFVDADANGAVDAGTDAIIKTVPAFPGTSTLVRTDGGGAAGTSRVAFGAAGTSVGGLATGSAFKLCDNRSKGRIITVSAMGRASVTTPATCVYP